MKNISFTYTVLALAAALALGACGGGGGGGDKPAAPAASAVSPTGGSSASAAADPHSTITPNAEKVRVADAAANDAKVKHDEKVEELGRIADHNSAEFTRIKAQLEILKSRQRIANEDLNRAQAVLQENKAKLHG